MKNKGAINLKELLYLIIIIIFLKPNIIDDFPFWDFLFNILRFSFSLILAFYYLVKNKLKISKELLYPVLLFIIITVSTIYHHGNIILVLSHYVPVIGLMIWININQKDITSILIRVYRVCVLLVVLNFIFLIVYPNGLLMRNIYLPVWLLGQKQDFINCFAITTLVGFLYYQNKYIKRNFKIVFILMLLSAFLTGAYGLLVFLIGMLITYLGTLHSKIKIRSNKSLTIVNCILILFCVFMAYNHLHIMSYFKMDSIKYDNLLTRFQMWRYALDMFKLHFLIGFGQVTELVWYATSNLPYYHTIVHNLYFDVLFEGGLTAIIIFAMYNIYIDKIINRFWNYKSSKIIAVCVFMLRILMLTECPYVPFVLITLSMACYSDIIGNYTERLGYVK